MKIPVTITLSMNMTSLLNIQRGEFLNSDFECD